MTEEKYTDPWDAVQDMGRVQLAFMRDVDAELTKLSIQVNQLEKAHNRLCHLCGEATAGTTIDQDNWAKNEMGDKNDSH